MLFLRSKLSTQNPNSDDVDYLVVAGGASAGGVAMKAEWANQAAGKVARLHGWAVNY